MNNIDNYKMTRKKKDDDEQYYNDNGDNNNKVNEERIMTQCSHSTALLRDDNKAYFRVRLKCLLGLICKDRALEIMRKKDGTDHKAVSYRRSVTLEQFTRI